jgi:putative membrane protein
MALRRLEGTWVAAHPRVVTAVLSIVGYVLVAASFLGLIPFPTLGREGVVLFSDAIAVINSFALASLVVGVWYIKQGRRRRHAMAMTVTFLLILLFLVLYLWKQSGGFTKDFIVAEGQFLAAFATPITYAYLVMLAIHVLLSILAVPVVLHAVVLAATIPMDRLGETEHPTVGRVAVAAWGLSLALGILTYWMLNHVYSWEPVQGAAMAVLLAVPGFDS